MDQPVTVDHGDLLEVLQAAEAWAGYSRSVGKADTADRVDKSIHALREQSLGEKESVKS